MTKGLNNNSIKKIIKFLLDDSDLSERVFREYLPQSIIDERKLCDLTFAFNHIHFPNKMEDIQIRTKKLKMVGLSLSQHRMEQ